MTETELMREVENNAREVRLAEQKIFQQVLEGKQKKSKRALLVAVTVFTLLFLAWVYLHCIPLVFQK